MELIAAAPAIARGARKLWTGIRKQPQPAAPGAAPADPEERLDRLESQVAELKKELAASSEIIKAMAEQNERLVEAVGILRVRVRALVAACVILAVLAAVFASKLGMG